MSDSPDTNKRSQAEADLEREIRKERKFSLSDAIGRLAGSGAMKGASPVSRQQQAEAAIETWLRMHLSQPALEVVLLRCVSQSELLLNNYDQPLIVLAAYCQKVLGSHPLLIELVRDCDVEWGRVYGERPFFDVEGSPPNPDDPYTCDSVRKRLSALLADLSNL
jgi:hypothetical protein